VVEDAGLREIARFLALRPPFDALADELGDVARADAPIVNERGALVGVVEDADLFAVQPRSWFGVGR
jgi:CBS-domain-containing membrane protein